MTWAAAAAALRAIGGFLWGAVVWLVKHPGTAAAIALAVVAWHYRGNAIAEHQAKVTAESQRDAATTRADAEAARTAAAVQANVTNEATITALREANQECTDLTAAAEDQRARALRDLAQARETIRAAERNSAREAAALYASDPICRSWATAAVCPGIADQLRRDEAADP